MYCLLKELAIYLESPINSVTQDALFWYVTPDISRMGRVTSDVVVGMDVTQFIGVGEMAIIGREVGWRRWCARGNYHILS